MTTAWLQNVLRTDIDYLLTSIRWVGIIHVVSTVSSLMLFYVFANVLPPAVFGNYKYIISVVAIVSAVSLTGIPQALVTAVASGDGKKVFLAFWYTSVASIVPALILLGLGGYYYLAGNSTLSLGLLLFGLLATFGKPFLLYRSYLSGLKNFKTKSILLSASTIVSVSLTALTAWYTADILYIVGVYAFSDLILTVCSYAYTMRLFPPTSTTASDVNLLAFGSHLSLIKIINLTASHIDKILVFQFLGAADTAIYTVATMLPDQLKKVSSTISEISVPKYRTRTIQQIRQNFLRKISWYLLFVAGATGAYVFIAPWIFTLLFAQYETAIAYSQLYALSLLALPLMLMIDVFTAHAKTNELYVLHLSTSLFSIGAVVVGLFTYGIVGVIMARILTRVFAFIVSFGMMQRLFITDLKQVHENTA